MNAPAPDGYLDKEITMRSALARRPTWREHATLLSVHDDIAVLQAAVDALSPLAIEEIWERHGVRRLWVLVFEGGDRVADILAATALGHAPHLLRAEREEVRQVVIGTMLRLVPGDVLLVVGGGAAIAAAVRQAFVWRATWDAVEGEFHSLNER